MSLDCGRNPENPQKHNHAKSTQKGPGQQMDLNSGRSCCKEKVLDTELSLHSYKKVAKLQLQDWIEFSLCFYPSQVIYRYIVCDIAAFMLDYVTSS